MTLEVNARGRSGLVTGTGKAHGPGIALALARAGADVAVNFDSQEKMKQAVASVQAQGRKAVAIPGDPRDLGQARDIVKRAAEALGKLDILVENNRTLWAGPKLSDTPIQGVRDLLELHTIAPYQITQAALPYLRRNPRGDIVYVASNHTSPRSQPEGRSAQVLTLAALEYMARVLAKEEVLNGIRVNVIGAGMGNGEALKGTVQESHVEELRALSPFGRFCTSEDIGHLCAFLVSDLCEYMTGQVIYVEGGGRRPEWAEWAKTHRASKK